jgi:hypothetical protein
MVRPHRAAKGPTCRSRACDLSISRTIKFQSAGGQWLVSALCRASGRLDSEIESLLPSGRRGARQSPRSRWPSELKALSSRAGGAPRRPGGGGAERGEGSPATPSVKRGRTILKTAPWPAGCAKRFGLRQLQWPLCRIPILDAEVPRQPAQFQLRDDPVRATRS